ncbi:MAG TPA: thioredoxin domain-containing protein [Anaerolineae bacterium]
MDLRFSPKEGRRRWTRLLPGLLAVAWLAGACAPSAAPAATPTAANPAPQAAVTNAPAAATAAPAAAAPTAVKAQYDASKLPAGVDSDGNFYRGDPKAPVKMVEFSDFQCPFCSRYALDTGGQVDETYVATGKVLLVFRHFPLEAIHPNALPGAKAAYCAGQQKPALFWAMHDWMFATQTSWSAQGNASDALRKQAVALGTDGAKYDACVADAATEARIRKDIADGTKLGVQGTPAFFVNDWFINGAVPITEFNDKIGKALNGQHPAPTPTPLPAGVQPYDPDPNRPGRTYDGSPSLGDAKAPLVWISFNDFKCQTCAQFAKDTETALRTKYVDTGKMRFVAKFYPTDAPHAAVASLCALDQGKFWEYRDALFTHQSEWKDDDKAALTGYAKTLGLDEAKFTKCLADAPGQPQIDEDMSVGQQIQMDRLPYFLVINPTKQTGSRIPGAQSLADISKTIDSILNPAPTPASQPLPTPKG